MLKKYYKKVPKQKIHEELISISDSINTFEVKDFFIIKPNSYVSPWKEHEFKKRNKLKTLKYCKKNFSYSSDNNSKFLKPNQLSLLIKQDKMSKK